MQTPQKILVTTGMTIGCVFGLTAAALSLTPDSFLRSNPEPLQSNATMQQGARDYRAEGLKHQQRGDAAKAKIFYQKAIALDPLYAIPYNDLGILYEAEGNIDKAEECYLKASQLDPLFASPYSNLAAIYERKRQLDKAAYYWEQRTRMGSSDDPWTEKSRARLDNIRSVLGLPSQAAERDALFMMQEVAGAKSVFREDDQAMAREYLRRAELSYRKSDYATAIKEAINAQQLDPQNSEIESFLEKVQTRALSQ